MTYDSTADTQAHIYQVESYLAECRINLLNRALEHDKSKLEAPEKEFFDRYTPLLASLEYGSPEYKQALKDLKPALEHHYAANRHHPEHYPLGVWDMSLFDIMEMLMDWKAASERHNEGDIRRSLEISVERFKLSPQLAAILANTIEEMGW